MRMLTWLAAGSPRFQGKLQDIVDRACKDAEIYAKHGVGGILVENMNDIPYVKSSQIGPETVAVMTKVCAIIRNILPLEMACGVQVLAGGNEQALAIALASEFNFIRAEGFIFGHTADEGYIDACAGSLIRYKCNTKAENILIFTDIKKKHSSHAVTADVNIIQTAKAAEFFLSDGVIITGNSTGEQADPTELESVKDNVGIPVIVGSGVTDKNLNKYMSADALIIGSHFKYQGRWQNEIEEERVSSFLNRYNMFEHS